MVWRADVSRAKILAPFAGFGQFLRSVRDVHLNFTE